jgi:hypothetical protein
VSPLFHDQRHGSQRRHIGLPSATLLNMTGEAAAPKDRSATVAAHRAHQARWRAEELDGWPPGPPTHPGARKRYATIDSCLAEEWKGQRVEVAGPNLMSPAAIEYAKVRCEQLTATGGLAEQDRLFRNLLSSQPLAFSIAGELRRHRDAAAEAIGRLAGVDIDRFQPLIDSAHTLDGIDAEWAPPKDHHTGDRTGFDIATHQALESGESHLLTIEVKYIDTFSAKKVDYDRYEEHLTALGLSRSATDQLVADGCSQFLRSVMLTDSVRRRGVRGDGGIDHSMAVVLARSSDKQARRVVDAIKGHELPTRVDFWSHEDFFDACEEQGELAGWAQRMRRRYVLASG